MTEAAASRGAELPRRVASAVVMIAAALAAAWAGGLWFAAFWALAGVAVGVEWAWMTAGEPKARRIAAQIAAAALALGAAALAITLHFFDLSLAFVAVLALGAIGCALAARPVYATAAAVPYGAAVFVGVLLIRSDPIDGLLATVWLFVVVWATDIAAFFTGRAIGGPKLAPRLSPKKTWSGALGGVAAAVVLGTCVAAAGGVAKLWPVAAVAFLAAVMAEVGDLFESGVKRVYGAKDSSQLIPGHGGLMDRLDGFLAASTLVAAIGAARGGFDGVGQGLLRW